MNLLGFLDRYGVADIVNRARVGLVTLQPAVQYIDSLPVKMFEYMSAGLPVIASNFPLWREIIEGNKCGICVNPLDIKAIAQAINDILSHSQSSSQMGENGKKAVMEKYNWDIEKEKLIATYRSINEKNR